MLFLFLPTSQAPKGGLFAVYCQSFARWRQAEQDLDDNGLTMRGPSGVDVPRPAITISDKLKQTMIRTAMALELDQGEQSLPVDPLAEHRKHAAGLMKRANNPTGEQT